MRLFAVLLLTACSTDVDLGGSGGLTDGSVVDVTQCGDLIAPGTNADCHACSKDAAVCQPNGCYGGFWCFPDASDCRPPPVTCP